MYIAIEGIKGTGKSSVLNRTMARCMVEKLSIQSFPITAPIEVFHPLEQLQITQPAVKNIDRFVEKLFIERAGWHQSKICFKDGIVLGDRSIITSYVTRWDKWGDPLFTINRVNLLQHEIAKPDVIVWMQCNAKEAADNIGKRASKGTGKKEEAFCMLQRADEVYQELFEERYFNKKIKNSDLIKLPASCPVVDLSNEIFSILKHYNNKK